MVSPIKFAQYLKFAFILMHAFNFDIT